MLTPLSLHSEVIHDWLMAGDRSYVLQVYSTDAFSRSSLTCTRRIHRLLVTALHGMQTRSSDENSVCLSVRPSVKGVLCDKKGERSVQIFISYERSFSPVFREEEWLVGDDPFYVKFWVNRPPLERNWSSLVAPQPEHLAKKVQLTLI